MKSLPSLVASSTVGVATTGLVFGRPQVSSPTRPTSNKRKATEYEMEHRVLTSSRSRRATTSTVPTPIFERAWNSSPFPASPPSDPQLSSENNSPAQDNTGHVAHLNVTPRRREGLLVRNHSAEGRKDSFSSRRNSWIRRLSTIQISSHQGSPRSSVGLDSPSLTVSQGSAAPILDTAGNPVPLPPNKLVKRSTSDRPRDGAPLARKGSRSQMPTLRRPATSHQRSVTLQQQMKSEESDSARMSPEQHTTPPEIPQRLVIETLPPPSTRILWRHYFESRSTRLSKERASARSSDSSGDLVYTSPRRIILPDGYGPPTLLKATMIMESASEKIPKWMEGFSPIQPGSSSAIDSAERESSPIGRGSDVESRKRPRRSLSMHFTTPTKWIPRSGSLRASKRGDHVRNTGKRFASAPTTSEAVRTIASADDCHGSSPEYTIDPEIRDHRNSESGGDDEPRSPATRSGSQRRARNSSSPLPPLSRFSSFNPDMSPMGLSSSSSGAPRRSPISPKLSSKPTTPSLQNVNDGSAIVSSPKVVIHQIRSPRIPEVNGSDRASTLVGSDTDIRGFASGDDDELDFQSDTVFDSYRTGTTGSVRARNTPLELMFDESPPDHGFNLKTALIREMTVNANFRESTDRIVEEDEGMSTPIKYRRGSDRDTISTPTRATIEAADDAIPSSPPRFSQATRAFARISLEDEDDEEEDWTRDDDVLTTSNPLSPPSASVNSRRISPAVRAALVDTPKTNLSSSNAGRGDDLSRSLFDWSEPANTEKTDSMGNSPRPKTVHGKQMVDGRGGRTIGRRGPTAIHVRSQSVPVIPDATGHREHGKLAPKFGTWGLGGKGVNEDWDNDFEFDGVDSDAENGTESMSGSAMLVPPAIQASQANVVGHVGQIREVCLLVEDLKRLRGLARERGILDGQSAGLWREAEGIIALAIPDEEDEILSPPRSPSSFAVDYDPIDDRYHDGGFDVEEMAEPGAIGGASIIQSDPEGLDNSHNVHRQSVLSPGDDIFGMSEGTLFHRQGDEQTQSVKSGRQMSNKGSTDVARSVMEHIHQHRATSDPLHVEAGEVSKKMPFDTTSLRDLVHRANTLTRILAEIIRKADGSTHSPVRSPPTERDSSPAFTRVFTDPHTTPPIHIPRSQSNNSILSGSIDSSPTRGLSKRMHMMTVV